MNTTPATRSEPDPFTATPLSARVSAPTSLPLPAVGHDLTWRRLHRSDLPGLLELDRLCGAVDHPRLVNTLDMFEEGFDAPSFDPELDSVVAVDPAGELVAYGESVRDSEAATIVKVHLNGQVRPDRRGEGIGTALLAWQEGRGLQLLASSEQHLPGWLTVGSESGALAQRPLLERAGFVPTRWWFTMVRDLAEPIPAVSLAPHLRIAPYRNELSEPARLVINDAFRDHWGSQPLNRADWESIARLGSFRPELGAVVLATGDDGSEELAGVLRVMITEAEWEPNGFSFGYIEVLGVARAWRGQGIARALLATTLTTLRGLGLEQAMLDVDSESPTGAVGLYGRLGFTEYDRALTLIKEY
ncbi:GNAT family N-acetyltransferase [Leucobacter sp. M11]|uniref:GNAT family N-acetyltransferase n=1 Tax=Leucobacter sp. M11 TaxID=2993565 RepID=UPI002D80ACBB|nr:GNAT family N-acetyltransferase [Leucobacter sp. M11]MEB4613125.1 GNAT family N-acetyltransferase [Leucobacter sp. M11]